MPHKKKSTRYAWAVRPLLLDSFGSYHVTAPLAGFVLSNNLNVLPRHDARVESEENKLYLQVRVVRAPIAAVRVPLLPLVVPTENSHDVWAWLNTVTEQSAHDQAAVVLASKRHKTEFTVTASASELEVSVDVASVFR
jgi:hypothetical protein